LRSAGPGATKTKEPSSETRRLDYSDSAGAEEIRDYAYFAELTPPAGSGSGWPAVARSRPDSPAGSRGDLCLVGTTGDRTAVRLLRSRVISLAFEQRTQLKQCYGPHVPIR
jgi:hypothetical protein